MRRCARALALAAWAASLVLPVVAPAPASAAQGLAAEVCSADGARTLPVDHRDGHAVDCPCCTGFGPALPPAPAAAAMRPGADAGGPVPPRGAVRAPAPAALPPSCGPPA